MTAARGTGSKRLSDRQFTYERSVHHLGEALITARYRDWVVTEPAHYDFDAGHYVTAQREYVDETAYFLSAFDTQEGFGLYFFCQLPKGAAPKTVAEAREALKPAEVVHAEHAQRRVFRQGDVFAIEMHWSTRSLPGPSERSVHVLETNHVATEVRHLPGQTYARGWLRHKPAFRRPDHHAVKLGDGKTWYLLVKNTVPEGRAWSLQGNVD